MKQINLDGYFKLLVAGPREGISFEVVKDKLDMLLESGELGDKEKLAIIEGGASGVDRHARNWAIENGIPYNTYEAAWEDLTAVPCVIRVNRRGVKYNVLAGHNRNAVMGDVCDKGVIVWDGVSGGTKNMLKLIDVKEGSEKPNKLLRLFVVDENGKEVLSKLYNPSEETK